MCAPATYQAPPVLPINDLRTMSEHISEAQTAPASISIYPRAAEHVQTQTYQALPGSNAISTINLHHKFGASYIIVFPKEQDSLAVIRFDAWASNWDLISDSIDDLRFSAGFYLYLITTTVNYRTVNRGFLTISQGKIYGNRHTHDINKKAPRDGSPFGFELPQKTKSVSIIFSKERNTLPIK